MARAGSHDQRRSPLCTIIIPTRHRPELLVECLRSIAEVDYPQDRVEVIVVDDGGGVRAAPSGVTVSVVRCPGIGPAGARNEGAQRAAGEVLAFTDDDCRVDRGWLRALVDALDGRPRRASGGYTINALPENRWSTASQRIVDIVYAYYNSNPSHAAFLATNNMAVPAEAFHDVGGFDSSFRTAEDRDFCRRWLARGLELTYTPKAIVSHAHSLTWQAFVRQHFDYGRGAFRFHKRAGEDGDAQLHVIRRFYALLPRLMRQVANGDGPGTLAGDVALWQAANAAGVVWEATRTVARRR